MFAQGTKGISRTVWVATRTYYFLAKMPSNLNSVHPEGRPPFIFVFPARPDPWLIIPWVWCCGSRLASLQSLVAASFPPHGLDSRFVHAYSTMRRFPPRLGLELHLGTYCDHPQRAPVSFLRRFTWAWRSFLLPMCRRTPTYVACPQQVAACLC